MKSVCVAALLAAALPARAEPLRRIAVIVGANHGALGRTELRYSYSDADQMAAVLEQVGQFVLTDVHVMEDPEPQAILDEPDRDLSVLKQGGGESMLVFYYSGHADTSALYPNGRREGRAAPAHSFGQRAGSHGSACRQAPHQAFRSFRPLSGAEARERR
jgi:hypothetical protein